ncbi:MAG TPA: protein kinase [Pyrinomonadaceae bacterium]|jgi:serine/threonine protein kinase
MIEPGALLQSRYRVVKQIGQGGMGAVYVANDERFQSTVAIKQTFFDDPMLRKAFEREAHLLNHLRHVALPRVSDHFVEGEGQFLVMEYIEGDELAESLQQRGVFPLVEVLRWADELLDALDYLHTHEPPIVHRDIKPQNMKLTPRGQIVLLDFGLAKGATTGTRATSATASVFGYSRNYAPLEQIQGTGTDTRSDLYSLGATLYHLLTGVAPVDGLTRAGAVINNQPDPLRPAHVAHAQVPESISKILHRAMALKAALRPATAAEMRTALRQAASVLARTTPHAAAARTHGGQPARHEATVLDGAAQMFGGQQAAAGTLSQTRLRPPVSLTESEMTVVDSSNDLTRPSIKSYSHTSFHTPETPPARKHSPSVIIGVALAVLAACAFVAFPLLRSPAVSPVASESQIEIQPAGAQSVAPGTGQTEAAVQTLSPTSGQAVSPSSNARPVVGESRTPSGQPQSGEAEGSSGSVVNADAARNGSPTLEAPADKSGLVIQSPAPSSTAGVKNDAAAEYDAQRAEDLRRRKQQQAQEEQRRRDQESFRPPPPPPHEGGYPPPGGGHRPPPHRPPFR